jgi:hypothetical protein
VNYPPAPLEHGIAVSLGVRVLHPGVDDHSPLLQNDFAYLKVIG